jgi:outer membrane putative beta-barrel porin/alpha-amylase
VPGRIPRWARVLAAGIVVLPLPAARAERPLDTEDAAVVAPAHLEIELSLDYGQFRGTRFARSAGVVTVGLVSGLDVSLESGGALRDSSRGDPIVGVTDSLLRAKYLMLEETDARPAFLVSPAVRLPTGRDELGFDGADVQLLGVVRKTFHPIQITGNVGYTFATEDRPFNGWLLSTSVSALLAPGVWPVAEIVGGIPEHDYGGTLLIRGGLIYALNDRVRLDAALAYGVEGEVPDVAATAGVTISAF